VIPIKLDSIVSYYCSNSFLVENPNADFYQSFGFMASSAADTLSNRARNKEIKEPV